MRYLPRRRWFQFRLRTLLALLVVCAPVFAWYGNEIGRYRRQWLAIEQLAAHHLRVETAPAGPNWLRALLPEGLLVEARAVEMESYTTWERGCPVPQTVASEALMPLGDLIGVQSIELFTSELDNSGLQCICQHRGLRRLKLNGSSYHDLDWTQLSRLTQLRELELGGSSLSDVELESLGSLAELRTLSVATPQGGAGLRRLADVGKLETLWLWNGVNDAGLLQVGRFAELRGLYVFRTTASGEGLSHLSRLTKLESLYLDDSTVDDEVLKSLPPLPRLTSLSLKETAISDAGLAVLCDKLPVLSILDISDTQISDVGLDHLLRYRELDTVELSRTRVTKTEVARVTAKAEREGRSLSLNRIEEWDEVEE